MGVELSVVGFWGRGGRPEALALFFGLLFPFSAVLALVEIFSEEVVVVGVTSGCWGYDDGSLLSQSIPNASDAGGPTGTIREPNSTPIVTS